MHEIGVSKRSIEVRFDPWREAKFFTIIVDGFRLCDTDNPRDELVFYYLDMN